MYQVWSVHTGDRLLTLKSHSDGVTCLQFNDEVIVSGSYDKSVKLWDFSACQLMYYFANVKVWSISACQSSYFSCYDTSFKPLDSLDFQSMYFSCHYMNVELYTSLLVFCRCSSYWFLTQSVLWRRKTAMDSRVIERFTSAGSIYPIRLATLKFNHSS